MATAEAVKAKVKQKPDRSAERFAPGRWAILAVDRKLGGRVKAVALRTPRSVTRPEGLGRAIAAERKLATPLTGSFARARFFDTEAEALRFKSAALVPRERHSYLAYQVSESDRPTAAGLKAAGLVQLSLFPE